MENRRHVRVHIRVQGRVQGVGFRAFVQSQAASRGLRGWVKNLPDGRVESEVEGAQELVNEFLLAVHQGPASAQVRNVEVEWMEPNARDVSFEIVY